MATHLVEANANVWIDRWELNVGDSILNKIQEAIEGSDALIIVLSQASVESEWCKKELTAGHIRELEEKRVVILPVLVEDCEIPLFLRDKLYADLRDDFHGGVRDIVNGIAKVTNPNQARLNNEDGFTDWAFDWGYQEESFALRFTFVTVSENLPITILTEINVLCNEVATERYQKYEEEGLGWIGRNVIAEVLFELGSNEDIRLLLEDQFPRTVSSKLQDSKSGATYYINVTSRKLGQDNGKDQLLNVSDYMKGIRDSMRHVSRRPTQDEWERLLQILPSAFDGRG